MNIMNFQMIRNIEDRISKNRKKLNEETDNKKKQILRLKIQIDEIKVKLERLK
jgi:hypothetical protein